MKKKIVSFYQIMAFLCILASVFPFNNDVRGEFCIASALFYIACELSDKKPMEIEI